MKLFNQNKKALRWLSIVALVLIIAIPLNYIVSKYFVDYVYESTAILILHSPSKEGEDMGSARVLGTYRAIASSNGMMARVIEEIGLDCTPEELKSKITISYEEDTGLIYIKARDGDGEPAKRIVDSLIGGLEAKTEELFGENPLKLVDGPYIPTKALWPNTRLNMLITLVIGIFLSLMIIVWDERRR